MLTKWGKRGCFTTFHFQKHTKIKTVCLTDYNGNVIKSAEMTSIFDLRLTIIYMQSIFLNIWIYSHFLFGNWSVMSLDVAFAIASINPERNKQKGNGKFIQHFLYAPSYGQWTDWTSMGIRSEAESKCSVTATGYIRGFQINHSHIMTDGLCTNTQNNTVLHKSLQTRLLSTQQRVVCATLLFTFINL